MELPAEYNNDFLGHIGLNWSDVPDRSPAGSLVFPPIGFFPFYGIGNGDYFGFYWPIGQEVAPPIVAFSSHDAWSLIPENSSVESLYACRLARTDGDPDSLADFAELVRSVVGKLPDDLGIRALKYNDYAELLAIDPKSPYYLCALADVELDNDKLDLAEHRYRESLRYLPEYVAAHFGLACNLRRQRRSNEAALHLRNSLIGPSAFYGGSFWAETSLPGSFRNEWQRKALMWLQGSKVSEESLRNDPFVTHVGKLKFRAGESQDSDLAVLKTIMEEYEGTGAFEEAARIWQLVGDMAAAETTSFRERHCLNPNTYGTRLAELLELSGNSLRAVLVRNMLANMDKHNGLYL